MPKYQVIYREHNKMQLETLHIGPFNTWDEAYDALCKMPAIGNFPETQIDSGSSLSGVKYVEPLFETLEEAQRYQNLTEEERDQLLSNITWAHSQL